MLISQRLRLVRAYELIKAVVSQLYTAGPPLRLRRLLQLSHFRPTVLSTGRVFEVCLFHIVSRE